MSVEPPSDILPLVYQKITEGSPVLALAERPDAPGEWTFVCALRLSRLADLATGSLGLWTDLDHADRIDGPQLRVVFQPEEGSATEAAWLREGEGHGYGHESWPYAVPVDLSEPGRRDAVRHLLDEGMIRVVWVDLEDGAVVCRHEIALTDLNITTLTRLLQAAEDRWPAVET